MQRASCAGPRRGTRATPRRPPRVRVVVVADLEDSGLRPQRQTVDVPRTRTAFLKVRVAATHDDFAAVHVLSAEA